jgi:hypothetical protein
MKLQYEIFQFNPTEWWHDRIFNITNEQHGKIFFFLFFCRNMYYGIGRNEIPNNEPHIDFGYWVSSVCYVARFWISPKKYLTKSSSRTFFRSKIERLFPTWHQGSRKSAYIIITSQMKKLSNISIHPTNKSLNKNYPKIFINRNLDDSINFIIHYWISLQGN